MEPCEIYFYSLQNSLTFFLFCAKYHFPAFHSYLISSLCTFSPLVFIHGCETGSAPAYHPLHAIARHWEAICVFFCFFLWILSSSRAAAWYCLHCSAGSGSVGDVAYMRFRAVATRRNILNRIPVERRPVPRRTPGPLSNTVLDPSSCS